MKVKTVFSYGSYGVVNDDQTEVACSQCAKSDVCSTRINLCKLNGIESITAEFDCDHFLLDGDIE